MREIKFRAWHRRPNTNCVNAGKMVMGFPMTIQSLINAKEGYEFKKVGIYGYDEHLELGNETILMQFTGLKDKNGKEIYEGDILEYKFNKLVDFRNGEKIEPEWIRERRVMRFIEDRFSFAKDIKKPNYFEYPSMSKVIGNIYENPELVAQKNMEG